METFHRVYSASLSSFTVSKRHSYMYIFLHIYKLFTGTKMVQIKSTKKKNTEQFIICSEDRFLISQIKKIYKTHILP